MPSVQDVLRSKEPQQPLFTIAPTASVLDAVEEMNSRRIGALIVMEQGQVVGIFTERDVLRRVVGEMRKPAATPIEEVMSRDVVCVEPDADLDEVSTLMKNRRIRHVPVCNGSNTLIGMISIGDVNAYHSSHREAALHYLNEYVYGRA
ncbi:MAG TPA: CBS domain-containing protein [Tepidisphaeraceae bacterium]|jgi:CBS domain-containing protein|nr:CBS domain-containing protein [Tepidisphaeraceae bacterium]